MNLCYGLPNCRSAVSILLAVYLCFARVELCTACGSGTASQTNLARDLVTRLFNPTNRNLFKEFMNRRKQKRNFVSSVTPASNSTATRTTVAVTNLLESTTAAYRTTKTVTVAATETPKPATTEASTYRGPLLVTGSALSSSASTETTPFPIGTTELTTHILRSPEGSKRKRYPRDCSDIQQMGLGQRSGMYQIFRPSCLNPVACAMNVTCDLQTDGGGWTVIQQRLDGTTSFSRNWKSYRNGFGDARNFWLGNEYVYEITNMLGPRYQLLIQMSDFTGRSRFALYQSFKILSERDDYTLKLGSMFGTAKVDNLESSRNAPFGTFDEDHDEDNSKSCGAHWLSGWWHHSKCEFSGNLNVPYALENPPTHLRGILWISDDGPVKIRTTQMKMRPVNFPNPSV